MAKFSGKSGKIEFSPDGKFEFNWSAWNKDQYLNTYKNDVTQCMDTEKHYIYEATHSDPCYSPSPYYHADSFVDKDTKKPFNYAKIIIDPSTQPQPDEQQTKAELQQIACQIIHAIQKSFPKLKGHLTSKTEAKMYCIDFILTLEIEGCQWRANELISAETIKLTKDIALLERYIGRNLFDSLTNAWLKQNTQNTE